MTAAKYSYLASSWRVAWRSGVVLETWGRRDVGDGLANGLKTRQYSWESRGFWNTAQYTSLLVG
jgi:hypothetical protein